ncbi:MAG: amidohydrolase [Flavobacteriaceae bacterium]|nr:amidohydrolase [Flavobacteriaceae bacterium]
MSNALKIALIQSELIWEYPEKNRINFSKKILSIKEDIDLIILPEMFTTGFTMNPYEIAETMQGESIRWLKKLAAEKNTAITGSLIIKENNNFYNRLVFVFPSGEIQTYDKRHTFTLAGEHKVYTAGNKKLIVDYKGWKICPLICYDLRFPVWSRNFEGYDVLIYVANWPKPRISAWDTLLKARAIENMSYCIGVNRIGKDENNYEYTGSSAAFDSLGKQISTAKPNEQRTEIITLKKESLVKTRDTFQFLKDQDQFTLIH